MEFLAAAASLAPVVAMDLKGKSLSCPWNFVQLDACGTNYGQFVLLISTRSRASQLSRDSRRVELSPKRFMGPRWGLFNCQRLGSELLSVEP